MAHSSPPRTAALPLPPVNLTVPDDTTTDAAAAAGAAAAEKTSVWGAPRTSIESDSRSRLTVSAVSGRMRQSFERMEASMREFSRSVLQRGRRGSAASDAAAAAAAAEADSADDVVRSGEAGEEDGGREEQWRHRRRRRQQGRVGTFGVRAGVALRSGAEYAKTAARAVGGVIGDVCDKLGTVAASTLTKLGDQAKKGAQAAVAVAARVAGRDEGRAGGSGGGDGGGGDAREGTEYAAGPDETGETARRHALVVRLLEGTAAVPAEFAREFRVCELLGDGAFGFVMAGERVADGKQVAMKFIPALKLPEHTWVPDAPNRGSPLVPREIALLRSLRHAGIIGYVGHWLDVAGHIVLVTELHGTEWAPGRNPALTPARNPGIRENTPLAPPQARGGGCDARVPSVYAGRAAFGLTMDSEPPRDAAEGDEDGSPLSRLTSEQEMLIRRRTSCDLFECIDAHKRIPEATAKFIFAQIALAVQYLHNKGIVHRDLKDENIVIDEHYRIKIIDFGSAAFIPERDEDLFTKFCGTTNFASPEAAYNKPYRGPEAEI
ncbi:hypothetical protein HK405_003475, partial [Cladochytrium tenue]